MNLIFEPDPREIDGRLAEEDALDVLVIDDERIATARHFDTRPPEIAARSDAARRGTSERDAVRNGAAAWAQTLDRAPIDIAYIPVLATYAQAHLAIELAKREVRVVVGATRETFLRLADDPTLHAQLWA